MSRILEQDEPLDLELMAYVDGTLPAHLMAQVEARLARDPDAREAVAQLRHYDNMLRDLARSADALPANLKIAALERELAGRLQRRRLRAFLQGPTLRRMAASVVLFAAGWGAHSVYSSANASMASIYPAFVQPTLAGHQSYTLAANQRREFGSDQMTEALEWLSDQMQAKIDSPHLERLGYTVESARLIVTGDQPVAVFYYRNAAGERVTVSMTPRTVAEPDYTWRVAEVGGERVAYWTSEHMNYAVVAQAGMGEITSLSAAVQ